MNSQRHAVWGETRDRSPLAADPHHRLLNSVTERATDAHWSIRLASANVHVAAAGNPGGWNGAGQAVERELE